MCPQEGVLERVLGFVEAAEHVTTHGEQARVVAVVKRLEGGCVPGAHELHQARVTGSPQASRTAYEGSMRDDGGHEDSAGALRPDRHIVAGALGSCWLAGRVPIPTAWGAPHV